MTGTEFIAAIAPFAIADMRRSGIAASLTIAQAALESGWGSSRLTVRANNLFGIKGTGPAGSISMQTTEYRDGKAMKVTTAFRAYNNWGESVADHSELIRNGVYWNRNLYSKVIGLGGADAAREIAESGYATDPDYASKLIQIMKANNLFPYDEMKEDDEMSAEDRQRLDVLEAKVQELQQRLAAVEGHFAMDVPEWAKSAVSAAISAGVLDTPSQGSYDFYRTLTILYRADLLPEKKEG
ncbi:glucosaminidase domain-containing protein [Paenibacillus sp. sgz5001063]|uniref:glucosaminidase domain-containing protein n=1 Tax=Paenibacillus sp. sgz5001063 TaxID=3242474 RepID=UPI0036D2B8F2